MVSYYNGKWLSHRISTRKCREWAWIFGFRYFRHINYCFTYLISLWLLRNQLNFIRSLKWIVIKIKINQCFPEVVWTDIFSIVIFRERKYAGFEIKIKYASNFSLARNLAWKSKFIQIKNECFSHLLCSHRPPSCSEPSGEFWNYILNTRRFPP